MGLPHGGFTCIRCALTCGCFLICLQIGNAGWGEWGEWSPCSATCGSGIQTRVRHCVLGPEETGQCVYANQTDEYSCYSGVQCKPVDGGWSGWGSWSNCTRRCGSGFHERWRKCDSPKPQYGGKVCEGVRTENNPCNLPACPPLYNGEITKDCLEGYVLCANGNQCIPESRRCDYWYDCSDGSDESACKPGEPVVTLYLNSSGMTLRVCALTFPILSTCISVFLSRGR